MLVAWIETLKQLSRIVIRSRDLSSESPAFATQNNLQKLRSDGVVLDTFSKLACKIWARTGHQPGTEPIFEQKNAREEIRFLASI